MADVEAVVLADGTLDYTQVYMSGKSKVLILEAQPAEQDLRCQPLDDMIDAWLSTWMGS